MVIAFFSKKADIILHFHVVQLTYYAFVYVHYDAL